MGNLYSTSFQPGSFLQMSYAQFNCKCFLFFLCSINLFNFYAQPPTTGALSWANVLSVLHLNITTKSKRIKRIWRPGRFFHLSTNLFISQSRFTLSSFPFPTFWLIKSTFGSYLSFLFVCVCVCVTDMLTCLKSAFNFHRPLNNLLFVLNIIFTWMWLTGTWGAANKLQIDAVLFLFCLRNNL